VYISSFIIGFINKVQQKNWSNGKRFKGTVDRAGYACKASMCSINSTIFFRCTGVTKCKTKNIVKIAVSKQKRNFCSNICEVVFNREPKGAKPLEAAEEQNKNHESENYRINEATIRKLQDSHWQEGLAWRKKMIQIIAQLRRDGVREGSIFRELKKCGLTNNIARHLYWKTLLVTFFTSSDCFR
jgi:hypothetical protein